MTAAGGRAASPSTGRSRSQPGADPARVLAAGRGVAGRARARCRSASPRTTGLRASAGGIDADHRARARCSACPPATPAPSRASCAPSPARATGVLLAQQTAANLHVHPGDTVTIGRAGPAAGHGAGRRRRRPARGRLAVPEVGAPPGAQPPGAAGQRRPAARTTFTALSTPLAAARPDLVARRSTSRLVTRAARPARRGLHAGRAGQARNLETAPRRRRAGRRQPRRGARQARQDALYAQLLFLFLGLPGAVLAGLLTAAIVAASAARAPPPGQAPAAHPRRVDRAASSGWRWPRPRSPRRRRRRGRPRRRRC